MFIRESKSTIPWNPSILRICYYFLPQFLTEELLGFSLFPVCLLSASRHLMVSLSSEGLWTKPVTLSRVLHRAFTTLGIAPRTTYSLCKHSFYPWAAPAHPTPLVLAWWGAVCFPTSRNPAYEHALILTGSICPHLSSILRTLILLKVFLRGNAEMSLPC